MKRFLNKSIIVFIVLLYLVSFVVVFYLLRQVSPQDYKLILLPFKNPLEEKMQKMTLEEKVRQLMFVSGQEGVQDNNFGGLIINKQFKRSDFAATQGLTLNKVATGSAILPFLGVDQEGSPVCRLTQLDCTGQREIETASQAGALGLKRGKELKDLNFNVVFAPVLDIAEDENDFIYPRTFNGPVAELGAAMIKGFKNSKIINCAKHFPGHSGTKVDSHYRLPVIECDEICLRERIEPFKKAIEVGVPMVMVGHLSINNLPAGQAGQQLAINNIPSSLSKTIITDLLRKELKFDGIIITDDLTMGAIKTYQPDLGEAAVRAILAGIDMVMVTGKPAIQEQVYQRLLKAVQNNEIIQERLNESLRRILQLKAANSLISN